MLACVTIAHVVEWAVREKEISEEVDDGKFIVSSSSNVADAFSG